ncbi:hypothetical protein L9F63_011202, partial [Diploptera punctata]
KINLSASCLHDIQTILHHTALSDDNHHLLAFSFRMTLYWEGIQDSLYLNIMCVHFRLLQLFIQLSCQQHQEAYQLEVASAFQKEKNLYICYLSVFQHYSNITLSKWNGNHENWISTKQLSLSDEVQYTVVNFRYSSVLTVNYRARIGRQSRCTLYNYNQRNLSFRTPCAQSPRKIKFTPGYFLAVFVLLRRKFRVNTCRFEIEKCLKRKMSAFKSILIAKWEAILSDISPDKITYATQKCLKKNHTVQRLVLVQDEFHENMSNSRAI